VTNDKIFIAISLTPAELSRSKTLFLMNTTGIILYGSIEMLMLIGDTGSGSTDPDG